jgi:hypothetical protein
LIRGLAAAVIAGLLCVQVLAMFVAQWLAPPRNAFDIDTMLAASVCRGNAPARKAVPKNTTRAPIGTTAATR